MLLIASLKLPELKILPWCHCVKSVHQDSPIDFLFKYSVKLELKYIILLLLGSDIPYLAK